MQTNVNRNGKTPFFERAQNLGATVLALLITFFAHPYIYSASGSVQAVTEFGARHYAIGWAMPFLWWVITFGGILLLSAIVLRVILSGAIINLIKRFA